MSAIIYTAKEGINLLGSEVGAWLADTVAETVTAVERVSNGDFPVNTTGWTAIGSATLDVVSAELRVTSTGVSSPGASQVLTGFTIGKMYVISSLARRGTCVQNVAIDIQGIAASLSSSSSTTNVTIFNKFIATATSHTISVYVSGAAAIGETAFFDNISCVIGDDDLSTTDKAMRYHGTIVKSAVAPGAGAMGYSNFSTLNFLSRAYGADLDITGALTIRAWVKHTSGINQAIAGNYNNSGDVGGYLLYLSASGSLQFYVISDASVAVNAVDPAALTAGQWTLVTGTITTAGLLSIYKNGALVGTTPGGIIGATVSTFKVGVNNITPINPFNGSITGVDVIPTALTASQILGIYNNEKHLFKSYAPHRIVGSSYSLDLILEQASIAREVDSTVVKSLGGAQETIERTRDRYHNITIGSIARIPTAGETTARQVVQAFMESVQAGETFSLDIYGSVATPSDAVNVIADAGYTFSPVSNNLFTTSLRVREV